LRRLALRTLRALHLIQAADYFAARADARKYRDINAAYRAAHSERVFPDPVLVFEVAGHARLDAFDQSGAVHAQAIASLLRETPLPEAPRILDWGCGLGRILAHLPATLAAPAAQFHGCDPSARAIAYDEHALPDAAFEHIAHDPPTPYAPRAFDAIYGVSILTHMPERTAQAWLAELARLVTDNGVVIVTSHGRATISVLTDAQRARFNAGEYIAIGGAKIGSRTYLSYFNEDAGKRLFAPYFADITFRPFSGEGVGHDFWLLRAPRRDLDASGGDAHLQARR
jgi:SAM-dependent methyltransferase